MWEDPALERSDGLWLFLAVTVLRLVALLGDYCLLAAGQPTITEFARKYAWFALGVLVVEFVGLVGLGHHLLNGRK